jgi:ADP-ribosylglycohydrolase
MNKEELKRRVVNGLYAQAVCDAVGDPFEFKTGIDPKMVSSFVKKYARLNITDDTQMALFGFEAYQKSLHLSGDFGANVENTFTKAYIDWGHTKRNLP